MRRGAGGQAPERNRPRAQARNGNCLQETNQLRSGSIVYVQRHVAELYTHDWVRLVLDMRICVFRQVEP